MRIISDNEKNELLLSLQDCVDGARLRKYPTASIMAMEDMLLQVCAYINYPEDKDEN